MFAVNSPLLWNELHNVVLLNKLKIIDSYYQPMFCASDTNKRRHYTQFIHLLFFWANEKNKDKKQTLA